MSNNGGYQYNKKTGRFEWVEDDHIDGFQTFLCGCLFCAVFIVGFILTSHP